MWVQGDCALLPIEYSTTEELAAYLWFRILQVRLFLTLRVAGQLAPFVCTAKRLTGSPRFLTA